MNFKCACCEDVIEGIPTFGWDKPLHYFGVPKERRGEDVFLTDDLCVIADQWFFIRGCIEIPVIGHEDPFIWGVWACVSEGDFMEFQENLGVKDRSHFGPYRGELSAHLKMYPETEDLRIRIYVRNNGTRPLIELEEDGHPLAVEQKNGISLERVAEIYACMVHNQCPAVP
ncbi:MAG TPA: DUF2199 domain-containing protein [Moraxellaceae bacterium]